MRADSPIPPRANDDPALPPAARPQSNRCKLIIGRCIASAVATTLGLLMVIFLTIPAGTQPEIGLGFDPASFLSSLNISTSHSKLITVDYPHMKLLLTFDGQFVLSCPSLASAYTQGPGNVTLIRAKTRSTLAMVTDSGLIGRESREVTFDLAAKAKRRLRLGRWWVAVFDVDVLCTGSAFTAPTDGYGVGDWMMFGGNLSCSLDIIPQR